MKFIQSRFFKWGFWIRIKGNGIWFGIDNNMPPLFSEIYGHRCVKRFFGLKFMKLDQGKEMNKELMKGINVIVSDNMWFDCEKEEMGITPDGLQEIISLCADEAIDVICNIKPEFRSDLHEVFVRQAEKAIEKRMK